MLHFLLILYKQPDYYRAVLFAVYRGALHQRVIKAQKTCDAANGYRALVTVRTVL